MRTSWFREAKSFSHWECYAEASDHGTSAGESFSLVRRLSAPRPCRRDKSGACPIDLHTSGTRTHGPSQCSNLAFSKKRTLRVRLCPRLGCYREGVYMGREDQEVRKSLAKSVYRWVLTLQALCGPAHCDFNRNLVHTYVESRWFSPRFTG